MDFVAIDVETANADMASICQIGIVKYSDGKLVDEWVSLVNPEDYFSGMNISIHGITENDVQGKPTFPEVFQTVRNYMIGNCCVCHTHFDRVSISQVCEKYNLSKPESIWVDSARVARRAWKDVAWKGYGLKNLSKRIGYNFNHHDALEDAKACAEIFIKASEDTGLDVDSWLKRVRQPIDLQSKKSEKHTRKGNPDGILYGEIIVFTGALSIPRREAADIASSLGCAVASSVTKKTTLVVVGDQDLTKLAGKEKSTKHLKAEELILKGQNLRILKESDFQALAKENEKTNEVGEN